MASGTSVGSLYYDLNIDDKNLKGQLDSADKSVKGFSDNLKSGMLKASAGLAVVGAGLTLISKNALDFSVDFLKSSKTLATQIGTTTTEASRLTVALQRMGIDAGKSSQLFGTFSKQIVETSKETDKNATALGRLGIATKDANGKQKDFTTILFATADKFKTMPDGIDKTALSMELFGKSGKDMIKVLNLGSEGIKKLEEQADKLGLTLTAQNIGQIEKYIQSQKDLKQSTDATKLAIGIATAPVLTRFNETLNDTINKLIGTDGPMKDFAVNIIAFGGPLAVGASTLLAFGANLATIVTALSAGALVFAGIATIVLAGLVAWGLLIYKWDEVKKFLGTDLGLYVQIALAVLVPWLAIPLQIALHWQGVLDFFKGMWNWITGNWPLLIGAIAGPFGVAVAYVATHLTELKNNIVNRFNGAKDFLFNAGRDIVGGLINGITSRAGELANQVSNMANNVKNKFKDALDIRSPSKVFMNFGENISEGLAKGLESSKGMVDQAIGSLANNVIAPTIMPVGGLQGSGQAISNNKTINNFNIGTIEDKSDADYILRRSDRNQELEGMGISPT